VFGSERIIGAAPSLLHQMVRHASHLHQMEQKSGETMPNRQTIYDLAISAALIAVLLLVIYSAHSCTPKAPPDAVPPVTRGDLPPPEPEDMSWIPANGPE
jgi:hypothetical protein